MKRLLLCLCLLLTACNDSRKGTVQIPPAPRPAPVLASQEEKDRIVVANAQEAAQIAPQVQPQADAIVAAVEAAPAANVGKLVREFEQRAKEQQTAIGDLTKERDEAQKKVSDFEDSLRTKVTLGGYGFAALLMAAGVFSFVAAAKIPYLGPQVGGGLIAASVATFGLVRAYEWTQQHPWVTLSIFLGIGFAAWRAHQNAVKK